MTEESNRLTDATVSRRTIAKGLAWSVPVLSLAIATPAAAASGDSAISPTFQQLTGPNGYYHYDGDASPAFTLFSDSAYSYVALIDNAGPSEIAGGTTFTFTIDNLAGVWTSLALSKVEVGYAETTNFTADTDSISQVTVYLADAIPVGDTTYFYLDLTTGPLDGPVTTPGGYATFTGTSALDAEISETISYQDGDVYFEPIWTAETEFSLDGPIGSDPVGEVGGIPVLQTGETYSVQFSLKNNGPYPVYANSGIALSIQPGAGLFADPSTDYVFINGEPATVSTFNPGENFYITFPGLIEVGDIVTGSIDFVAAAQNTPGNVGPTGVTAQLTFYDPAPAPTATTSAESPPFYLTDEWIAD